jgi:hypothetical protein
MKQKVSLQCSQKPATFPRHAILFQIHININLASTPKYLKWLFSFGFPHQPLNACPFPHTCHMPRPSHPSQLITLTILGARSINHQDHYEIFFSLLSFPPCYRTSVCVLTLIRRFKTHRQNQLQLFLILTFLNNKRQAKIQWTETQQTLSEINLLLISSCTQF